MEHVEGMIFDIQRYSLHDGPGLRTNVFFKGCPLRCAWCANPESLDAQPEVMLSAQQCINCGQFGAACPAGWKTESTEEYRRRAALCPTGAIRWIGERRTAGDVLQEVLRDAPFYGDDGGLTLTGGEPTMQPEFAEALLRLAKAAAISTAMETCGHASWNVLARLLPFIDDLLFDLKHVDPERHRELTGVDNRLILSNLRLLVKIGAPVTIRIPLIPGANTDAESLHAIGKFLKELDGWINGIELLPYHTFGKPKYAALGRDYPWNAHSRLTDQQLADIVRLTESYGRRVEVR